MAVLGRAPKNDKLQADYEEQWALYELIHDPPPAPPVEEKLVFNIGSEVVDEAPRGGIIITSSLLVNRHLSSGPSPALRALPLDDRARSLKRLYGVQPATVGMAAQGGEGTGDGSLGRPHRQHRLLPDAAAAFVDGQLLKDGKYIFIKGLGVREAKVGTDASCPRERMGSSVRTQIPFTSTGVLLQLRIT